MAIFVNIFFANCPLDLLTKSLNLVTLGVEINDPHRRLFAVESEYDPNRPGLNQRYKDTAYLNAATRLDVNKVKGKLSDMRITLDDFRKKFRREMLREKKSQENENILKEWEGKSGRKSFDSINDQFQAWLKKDLEKDDMVTKKVEKVDMRDLEAEFKEENVENIWNIPKYLNPPPINDDEVKEPESRRPSEDENFVHVKDKRVIELRPSKNFQEKIEIPKKKFKKGAIYKVGDCYYNHEGEFSYRVFNQ